MLVDGRSFRQLRAPAPPPPPVDCLSSAFWSGSFNFRLADLSTAGLDCRPYTVCQCQEVKAARTRLPSVGFRSWSRFLAVSLHVTWVVNPAVGCHYSSTTETGTAVTLATLKRAATNSAAWWTEVRWVWTVCLSVAAAIWTQAWVQHANHSATEPTTTSYHKYHRQCTSCLFCWLEINGAIDTN